MIIYIESTLFVAIVFSVALLFWVVRSFQESDPAPFLSTFTYFAFIGQCILVVEVVREGSQNGIVFGLLLIEVCLVLFQILTVRAQTEMTSKHYIHLLESNKLGNITLGQIENWADVLLRITGIDFFPEFYQQHVKVGGPHEKRRHQAVSILPSTEFKCGADGITPQKLIVPAENRRFLWRAYAMICLWCWIVFIISTLVARRHL